jgi:hypothetical protein
MTMTRRRQIIRSVFGAGVGLVAGLIASINVVIFGGIDAGYEATPIEVFEENVLVGMIALLVLVAGPIVGITVALRERHRT